MPTQREIDAVHDLIEACDEADTAFATLNIGRDHGITPQASRAMLLVWHRISVALAKAKGSRFHAEKAKDLAELIGPAAHADRRADAV